MKKITSILFIALTIMSFNAFSQSNLTWTLKGHYEEGAVDKTTQFKTSLSGFETKKQADDALTFLKNMVSVKSVEVTNQDAKGNCDLVLTMNRAIPGDEYLSFAKKMGVVYIVMNNSKKTVAEMMAPKTTK